MRVYLDTTVLIVFLFGEVSEPDRFEPTQRLVDCIEDGEIEAVISLYAFQEIYGYVVEHFSESEVDQVFRLALADLLDLPLAIFPYLDRAQLNLWKHKITLPDPADMVHAAIALQHHCDSLATYDEHFRQMSDLIDVYSPDELLLQLAR